MIKVPKYTIYQEDFATSEQLKCKQVVVFRAGGRHIPMQPWPQQFYISRELLETDMVAVRPLTLTGVVKGIFMNFITMNLHRIKRLAFKLGFYDAEIDGSSPIWTINFSKTLKKRKKNQSVWNAYEDLTSTMDVINKGDNNDS